MSRLLATALEGLLARRLRSALAALGLMAGVAAVVLMVAVAQGTRNQVLAQVTALGSDLVIIRAAKAAPTGIRATTGREKSSLRQADAKALARLDAVAHAVPLVSRGLRVSSQGVTTDTLVLAAAPEIFQVESHRAVEGRLFSEREDRTARRVAVVGPSLRQHLVGQASLLGRTLEIKKQPFLVIGELAPKGLDPNGQDLDDRLFIPLRTGLTRLLGNQRHVEFIITQAEPGTPLKQAQEEMRALLRQRHRLHDPALKDDFTINTQLEVLAAQEESSRTFGSLTVGVAAISLLVAGVGIMAVQLMGVRERRAEIGVRRAVGAKRRDILR
ncbi:MAG: hypothetical protein C0405_15145, partial [Desulfovibrio sp.]|nr:hypothetical protein [Desulfovibrio sp.]